MSCELNLRYRLTGTDDEQMYETTLQCLADAIADKTHPSTSSTSGGGSTGPTGPMGLPGSNGAVGPTGPIGPTESFVASYESLVLNSTVQQLSPSNAYTFLSSCGNVPIFEGRVHWGAYISGTSNDIGQDIAFDGNGGVYVTGQYASTCLTAYHSNGCASSVNLANGGSNDTYVIKYNTLGAVQWGGRISGTSADQGQSIASDGNGGIYVTGQYNSTNLTAYHSNGCASSVNLANSGFTDAYVIKYNTMGDVVWGGRISGTSTDQGFGVASDGNGGVYVTGYYNSANLTAYHSNGCASSVNLANNGSSDAFIIKYNTSGTVIWGGRIGSTASDQGLDIASDCNGGVYITGFYNANLIAYHSNGCASSVNLANSGQDAYLIKYNTMGDVVWGGRIGGTAGDQGQGVASDCNGGVYVTGYYNSTNLIAYHSNGCASSVNLVNTGQDAYLIKYNTMGDVVWGGRISGTFTDQGLGVTYDGSDGVYVTGQYSSTCLIAYHSNGCASSVNLANSGLTDVYLVKYNTLGAVIWGGRIGGTSSDTGQDVASDGNGGVYVTGVYSSTNFTAYHSNGCASSVSLPHILQDAFIIKYNDTTTYEPTLGNLSARSSVGEKVILSTDTYQGGKVITVNNLFYNSAPASTIQMNNKGDSVRMIWNNDWYVVDNNGAMII